MASSFVLGDSPVGKYFGYMAELGVMRVFVQYGIFNAIPDDTTGILLEDLAAKLGQDKVDYKLLERMSRLLIGAGVLASPSPGYVALTATSKAFQDPQATGFYSYLFDFFMGPAVRWPGYFQEMCNGTLQEPPRSSKCPAGFALGMPDKTAYEILAAMPEQAKTLNSAMAMEGDIPITGVYDFSWITEYAASGSSPDRTLIIDVGGGKGQALKAILEETTGIPPARCALQDQAFVVQAATDEIEKTGGVLGPVKKIGRSFFEEQIIKGALVYYIRRVLNDWSDYDALQILKQVRAACAPDSKVLIAEYLRPEQPTLFPSAVDMFIMSIGGKVRGEAMFRELAGQAGFSIKSVSRHQETDSGVIEMIPV